MCSMMVCGFCIRNGMILINQSSYHVVGTKEGWYFEGGAHTRRDSGFPGTTAKVIIDLIDDIIRKHETSIIP